MKTTKEEMNAMARDPALAWLFDDGLELFEPGRLYSQAAIARVAGCTPRTVWNWWHGERPLLPAPDTLVGGRVPSWAGRTLNGARAFAKPTAEQLAGIRREAGKTLNGSKACPP